MKEIWIKAHDELIEEYLEDHPEADWSEAYEATGDKVDDRAADMYAEWIDHQRMLAKEGTR